MAAMVTIEIPAHREGLVRHFLAFQEELDSLAMSAPDGTVLDACERVAVEGGRDLNRRLLQDAVQRRIDAAEKKGRRCGPAGVAARKRTGGRQRGN